MIRERGSRGTEEHDLYSAFNSIYSVLRGSKVSKVHQQYTQYTIPLIDPPAFEFMGKKEYVWVRWVWCSDDVYGDGSSASILYSSVELCLDHLYRWSVA